jgi:hypothetical protein
MHSWESIHGGRHRRPRIGTILVVAVLVALVVEPIVMYRTLVSQKEQRRAAAELTMPTSADRASDFQ